MPLAELWTGGKMNENFIVFGSPIIEQPEIDEVVDSMQSGWLGTGAKVGRFEEMFREYKGADFAIAVNSCTAAMHLSMLALGIGPGDEVILPVMTFAATANAVIHSGATPVFVDCDRRTMNIDPDEILAKLTPKTKAIMPVHFAGRPCEMATILEIARSHGLRVIEDCAHAIEAEYHDMATGTIGDIGCFSFYVTKNIVTGEGGMVITDDKDVADKIKILALHGMSKDAWMRFSDQGYKHYQVVYCGYKYNMTDMQAAIGIHQLPRVDRYWNRRSQLWARYDRELAGLPAVLPFKAEADTRHAYHLYTLLLDVENLRLTRDQFLDEMTKRDIGVGVHYISLNLHPFYQEYCGCRPGEFPNAEWISERTVTIPLSARLTDDDASRVIEAVRDILS